MNELFFGAKKKKKTKHSPHRKRSPTRMCRKKLSLAKLRKLAVEHGVNIFSEAKRSVSKRTGMPKKPKMVGCATLMKRLNEAGLDHLYKVREVKVHVTPDEMPTIGFDDVEPGFYLADPNCLSAFDEYVRNYGKRRTNISTESLQKLRNKLREKYSGFERGGPTDCELRKLVRKDGTLDTFPIFDNDSKYTPPPVTDTPGDDLLSMNYGRRYMSGARPKKTHKHVGVIEVKGRTHHVFKGENGGLFYLKGKKGTKVYIDKERLKKKSKQKK